MKILLVNFTFKWRSTFFRAFHFGRCLVKMGHDVTLLTISVSSRFRANSFEAMGVKVIETPAFLWGFGRVGWDPRDIFWRLRYILRNNDFDLVHGFDCRPAVLFPSLLLKRLKGIPYISDWADWWGRGGIIEDRPNKVVRFLTGGIEVFFEEKFRRMASGLTVTSRALRERAMGLGLDPKWVFYIPSGCDIHSIVPMDKDAARDELGLDKNSKIIEFMGFVHYDLDLAIRSFAEIRKRSDNVKLLLVGPESPITGQLKRELGLDGGIIETGIQPYEKMSLYLGCADVLLLPYADKICNVGRGPIKLGDYLASGRPSVSNPVGDIKYIFADDEIGLLADDNAADFAEKVMTILDDPETGEKMGRNARRVAEEKYSWEILSEQIEDYYNEVLEHRSP